MASKTLKTRIKQHYLTLAEASALTGDSKLLAGELAIVSIPSGTSEMQNEPCVLIKVGDGEHDFGDLPWITGYAGDVYDWAKASTKPAYTADEIDGLAAYIGGKVQDTNTKYQLVANGTNSWKLQSKELGGAWTDETTITVSSDTLTTGSTAGTVKFNGADVKVKDVVVYTTGGDDNPQIAINTENPVSTTLGSGTITLNEGVSNQKTELGYEKVSHTHGAGNVVEGTWDNILAAHGEAVAAQNTADKANTNANKAQTAADTAQADATKALDQIAAVPYASTPSATNKVMTQAEITALGLGSASKRDAASELTTASTDNKLVSAGQVASFVNDQISDVKDSLSGAMHFVGKKDSIPASTSGYNAGDVIIVGNKEYVCDATNAKWVELGDESAYIVKGGAAADIATGGLTIAQTSGLQSALDSKLTAAQVKETKVDSATSADTASKVANALTVGTKSYNGSAAVSIAKADLGLGNVDNTADSDKSVASAAKLTTARTITLSGNVSGSTSFDGSANVSISTTVNAMSANNLTQASGDYLILDCNW